MIQKWEYLKDFADGFWFFKINGVKYATELEYLNARGKEGWELVQAPSYQCNYYIFKRPINN